MAPGLVCMIFVLGLMVKPSDGAAPTLWTTPSINAINGTGTLGQTLAEDFTVGTVLGSVTINNVATAYEILSQTYDGMFNVTLNSVSGDIYLINNTYLDFETDKALTVVIKGSNADGLGVATLTITVTDANDNTPTFSASSYSAYIASTLDTASTVYTMMASDADSTSNNDISYTIFSGDASPQKFSIGVSSGAIKRTTEAFTTSLYTLVIHATDGGGTALTGSATISVYIDSGGATTMVNFLTTASGLVLSYLLGTRMM